MNGGSLGLRSSSYGSLQQQYQQQQLHQQQLQQQQQKNSSSLDQSPVPPPPPLVALARKSGKNTKEKERLFPWIFKFAGKKVGMLFLCVISAFVFAWVLYMGKGDDAAVEGNHPPRISLRNAPTMDYKTSLTSGEVKPSPVYFTGYTLPPGNPCETFTLPPPPADKKRTGPRPCPVCYLPLEDAIARMPNAPSYSPILRNLTYIYDQHPTRPEFGESEFGGSEFGGYPTLKQRNDSYDIRDSMTVPCGFVKGTRAGIGTGFDIDEEDLSEMDKCRGIVVASAIFGNFDVLRQPTNISDYAKKSVCFYMFLDEETAEYMRNTSVLDESKKVGLWRIVVVHNIPYEDARRTGKIPKLLLHRLFTNARYSLWMDGKLELVVDPYQILERFLWRQNASFAISRHYRRFDVFVEAEANKAAGKYDNASIDFQIDFYRNEGLTPYSEAKLPITSDVPEGCVIIREHIPITNLFTCLWFHEVDRFTSRDQISFATVRDKIRAKTNWTGSMFLDCERRNFVVQGYHRDLLERMAPPAPVIENLPPFLLLPSPSPPPPPQPQFPQIPQFPQTPQLPQIPQLPSGGGGGGSKRRSRRGRGKRRNRKVDAGGRTEPTGLKYLFR